VNGAKGSETEGSGATGTAGGENGSDKDTQPGGEGQALVTAHLNEADLYLKKKDYARARAAAAEALKISPESVSGLLLAMEIEQGENHYDRAIEIGRGIVAKHPDDERSVYLELGRIYKSGGRAREGIAYFQPLVHERPEVAEIRAALGSLLLKDGQEAPAEKE